MASFTLASIGDLIHLIVKCLNFPNKTEWDQKEAIPTAIADMFYFTGNVSFYVLVLLRIALPFELNKLVSYSLASLIFIFGLSSLSYVIGVFFLQDYDLRWLLIVITLTVEDIILSHLY